MKNKDHLAYYDSFNGLIPCIVKRVYRNEAPLYNGLRIEAVISANRGGWIKGNVIDSFAFHFIKRSDVFTRSGIVKYRVSSWKES